MHQLHELFSSEGVTGHRVSRGDVRVRLLVALAAIVAVVASTRISFGLIATACCLVALAMRHTSLGTFARRLTGPLAVAAVVLAARTFMTGTTPLARLDLGFCHLTATREGLRSGALIASRVLGSLGIVTLLCRSSSMLKLLAAFHWAKVPATWLEIAVLMYRDLYILFAQAVCVVSAQRVRLGYSGLRRSFQSVGSLAGIVILRSLEQAEKSHEAMMARGYHGRLPLPSLPVLPRRQWGIAAAGVTFIVAAYFLAERWFL